MELTDHLSQKLVLRNAVPPMTRIAIEVALSHGLTVQHLKSPRRFDALAAARGEFYYRVLKETEISIAAIGRFIGRNHRTVFNGVWRYCEDRDLPFPRWWSKSKNHRPLRRFPQRLMTQRTSYERRQVYQSIPADYRLMLWGRTKLKQRERLTEV